LDRTRLVGIERPEIPGTAFGETGSFASLEPGRCGPARNMGGELRREQSNHHPVHRQEDETVGLLSFLNWRTRRPKFLKLGDCVGR
jgi:hypothetical protein